MSEFFDFIREDPKVWAPMDSSRGFLTVNVESLDAPDFIPAGSTVARSNFHVTSFTFRIGG